MSINIFQSFSDASSHVCSQVQPSSLAHLQQHHVEYKFQEISFFVFIRSRQIEKSFTIKFQGNVARKEETKPGRCFNVTK